MRVAGCCDLSVARCGPGGVCVPVCGTRRCALTTVFSESYQFSITGFTRSLCRIRARDARGPVPIGGTCSARPTGRTRCGAVHGHVHGIVATWACVKREIRQTFRLQQCGRASSSASTSFARAAFRKNNEELRILKGYIPYTIYTKRKSY